MGGKKPIPLVKEEVIALYLAGETTVSLAKRYDCSRTPINRLLAKAGVARTIAEDNARRYKTMDTGGRKLQVAAANMAARGRKRPLEESLHIAHSKQGKHRSRHERAVSEAMSRLGIEHIPQIAIGLFNGDLGIPSHRILVELDGGEWHSSAPKKIADEKQCGFICGEGWKIVRYRGRALQYPELIALDVKRICADPAIFGSQRMIRRHVKDLLRVANHAQAAFVASHHDIRDRVISAIVREDEIASSD